MLKQFIPNEYCLKCDICCRFGQKNSVYAPKFLPNEAKHISKHTGDRPVTSKGQVCQNTSFFTRPVPCNLPDLLPHNGAFICQYFSLSTSSCKIYNNRPLDCQLYPYMITYDKEYENIILALDTKCPYAKNQTMGTVPTLEKLSGGDSPHFLKNLPHDFVMPYQPDTIKIATIKNLGGLKALALEHKPIFNKYLAQSKYSARSFVNIYIWSDLFNILWKIIDNNLCVFYKYKNEFNMLLPPILPKAKLSQADCRGQVCQNTSFFTRPVPCNLPDLSLEISRGYCSRVENIAEGEVEAFKKFGLKIHKNTGEYIYLAEDIAELKGNKFASHRAAKNNFIKNNEFTYRPFEINDIDECLFLYSAWMKDKKNKDNVYQGLMRESFSAQKKAMLNFEELGLIGRAIEINGKIQAYTFAFKMNNDTYCTVFETADTNIKGLAQFIFSRLAQELHGMGAKYINAMDDSGLENLQKTKLSWHPCKILTNYIGVV